MMPAPRAKTFSALHLVAAFVVLLCLLAFTFVKFYMEAKGPLEKETLVLVSKGTGVSGIAQALKRQGALSHPLFFRLGYYIYYFKKPLLAGEYQVPAGASPMDLLRLLAKGDVYERIITVPEGWSALQVMQAINAAEGLTGEKLSVLREGSVLPETYQYIWGETYQEVAERMQKAHDAAANKIWEQRASGLPFETLEQAITLASVVEKETGIPEERGEIAAVFINRLGKKMPLQSDPTVIYALTQGLPLGRKLSRHDLEDTKSPYNTYKNPGLPPGPICNPGLESLKAVLNPPFSDALYFVADGKTGGHVFSKTLDEHNRNVRRYKLELLKQKQESKEPAATKPTAAR